MFEHWVQDQLDERELFRMNSILTGSFTNPKAAQDMIKADQPDYVSSEEEFEKSLKMIEEDAILHPRKRKKRPIFK